MVPEMEKGSLVCSRNNRNLGLGYVIESWFSFPQQFYKSKTSEFPGDTYTLTMVCLACLLPLFLVPIVNILPLLFYYLKGKVYALFGWEYRKPEIAPPSCPYKPSVNKEASSKPLGAEVEPSMQVPKGDGKQD